MAKMFLRSPQQCCPVGSCLLLPLMLQFIVLFVGLQITSSSSSSSMGSLMPFSDNDDVIFEPKYESNMLLRLIGGDRVAPVDNGNPERNLMFHSAARTEWSPLWRFRRTNVPLLFPREKDESTGIHCSREQILQMPGIEADFLALFLEGSVAEVVGDGGSGMAGHRNNCSRKREEEVQEKGEDAEIKPDMSLQMRALCPFERVRNVDGRRWPRRIPQVRCLCANNDQVRCEPVYYDIKVFQFDAECQSYQTGIQRVALACVPTLKPRSRSEFLGAIGKAVDDIPREIR